MGEGRGVSKIRENCRRCLWMVPLPYIMTFDISGQKQSWSCQAYIVHTLVALRFQFFSWLLQSLKIVYSKAQFDTYTRIVNAVKLLSALFNMVMCIQLQIFEKKQTLLMDHSKTSDFIVSLSCILVQKLYIYL